MQLHRLRDHIARMPSRATAKLTTFVFAIPKLTLAGIPWVKRSYRLASEDCGNQGKPGDRGNIGDQ